MVKISRRQNLRGQRKTRKSLFSVVNVRNLFLFVLVFAVWKIMTASDMKSSPGEPSPPKSFDAMLIEYKKKPTGNLRKDREVRKDPKTTDNANDETKNVEEDERTDAPHGKDETENPDEKADDVGAEKSAEDLNLIVIDKKGTGPTSVGYVKDFIEERKSPVSKSLETPLLDPSPEVAKLVNEKSVLPCRDVVTGYTNGRCLDQDTPLIAYNPEFIHRTWCGQEIKEMSAVVMTEHCADPITHLFPAEVPPITGSDMPPIVIKSSTNKKLREEDLEKVECNIPCQVEKGLDLNDINTSHDYFIDDESWKITMDMKSGNSMKDRKDYIDEHYYSTGSLLSSIPLSNFDSRIHSLRNRPAVDFDTAKEKAIYLVDEKCSAYSTKRNRWFDAVSEKMTVDSYGTCGHNTEVPQGMTISTPEGRIALSKQYRIVLAFDDTTVKDQISGQIFEAFVSGAVPVVVGADNLRERMPPNSFINVNDFNKWDELGDYVKKVVSDKELWMWYHKWRDDEEAVAAFEKQFGFTHTNSTCRLCRWAYAKKYGLGWDHIAQEVRSVSKVPKENFCTTADHGLVSKPFLEQWVSKKNAEEDEKVLEEDAEGESCSSPRADGGVVVDSFSAHRKVVQHDGVTDFLISEIMDEATDSETILRLTFPGVRNPEGACFYNTHLSVEKGSKVSSASIQDDLVKITVLADWDTTISSLSEGNMEVIVKNHGESKPEKHGSTTRRVRVIIEEMNEIFDKMTEFHPSSFSKLMMRDFINPISVFFVDS